MESVGEKLRKAREAKNVSLDQVSRDTNIAKRYLLALEEEDVSLFPGDTYAIGFLRNYSEYLGLNPAEMTTLYKNMRLQEQPVPMEELLGKKRSIVPYILLGGVALLVGLGVFFWLNPLDGKKEPAETPSRVATKIEYTGGTLGQPFIEGDEVLFPEEIGSVRVVKVGATVELAGSFGRLVMKQGQESLLDLPEAKHLVKVTCRTLQHKETPPKAQLTFELVPREAAPATARNGEGTIAKASVATAPAGNREVSGDTAQALLILESPVRAPFTLEIEFTGYCFFRYQVDNQEREEKYFRKGETFKVDVQREIFLGFSNAGALRGRIQGNEIKFGRPGQVRVGMLKWVESPTEGSFRLEFLPLD
ncbi:MAG: helix-turn-helix domain-containing protein [Spirochaetales bacterium]